MIFFDLEEVWKMKKKNVLIWVGLAATRDEDVNGEKLAKNKMRIYQLKFSQRDRKEERKLEVKASLFSRKEVQGAKVASRIERIIHDMLIIIIIIIHTPHSISKNSEKVMKIMQSHKNTVKWF